ncbi:hypothetical protein [Streptomyces sp. NBC_01217]|uniref:hypothetical protein n=1 Tax=Streptomyces sp. NBC_01217 TaxID=2903779 RepID=UPI002E137127|nr:hypothetical protein OG507_26465 [Streptomyces sp. NBC_01217]
MRRTLSAAAAAVALLAGAGACTSSDGATGETSRPAGSASAGRTGADRALATGPQACADGTYTWFNTQRLSVLNGVTEPQRITAGPTRFSEPMRRLRTDMAYLRTDGPKPDQGTVLLALALALHLGLADKEDKEEAAEAAEAAEDPTGGSGLGAPGDYAPLDSAGGEVSGPGRLVQYSFFSLIETDFRHTCGPGGHREPTVGHVMTWNGAGSGILDCEEPLRKQASAAAREARRLSCGR